MILVVDDNEDTLDMLMVGLSIEGFEVSTARSVAEALLVVKDQSPDAIVTDLHMPGAGGDELCRVVAGTPTVGIPVLIVSADSDPAMPDRLGQWGACAVMLKPVAAGDVADMLRGLLSMRGFCSACTFRSAELQRCGGPPVESWSKHPTRLIGGDLW